MVDLIVILGGAAIAGILAGNLATWFIRSRKNGVGVTNHPPMTEGHLRAHRVRRSTEKVKHDMKREAKREAFDDRDWIKSMNIGDRDA